MRRFHGTDDIAAQDILNVGIDVTRGGGELGQGFYVGNLAHQAATWAYHKGRRKCCGYKVIQFDIVDVDFDKLNRKYIDGETARNLRKSLQMIKKQREYTYGTDAVIAPVVGRYIPNFTQIKFEGEKGQTFINLTAKHNLDL